MRIALFAILVVILSSCSGINYSKLSNPKPDYKYAEFDPATSGQAASIAQNKDSKTNITKDLKPESQPIAIEKAATKKVKSISRSRAIYKFMSGGNIKTEIMLTQFIIANNYSHILNKDKVKEKSEIGMPTVQNFGGGGFGNKILFLLLLLLLSFILLLLLIYAISGH